MSPAFRRFVFAALASVFAIFCASGAYADATPKKKHAKHAVVHSAKHKKHTAKAKKRVIAGKPHVQIHMPPPGHEGQERDDWFMRRRTWPDETIDPNAYPTMLAQAARMPIYGENSRNHKLSVSQWQCIG